MQLMIVSKACNDFDAKVNSALAEGATIVPGTTAISQTSYRKADGSKFHQSRYSAVVELTDEQSNALLSARRIQAELAAQAAAIEASCDGDSDCADEDCCDDDGYGYEA